MYGQCMAQYTPQWIVMYVMRITEVLARLDSRSMAQSDIFLAQLAYFVSAIEHYTNVWLCYSRRMKPNETEWHLMSDLSLNYKSILCSDALNPEEALQPSDPIQCTTFPFFTRLSTTDAFYSPPPLSLQREECHWDYWTVRDWHSLDSHTDRHNHHFSLGLQIIDKNSDI